MRRGVPGKQGTTLHDQRESLTRGPQLPLDFVVLEDMNLNSRNIKGIDLVAAEPHSPEREKVLNSIEKPIGKGSRGFTVIRIAKDGSIAVE